VQTNEVAPPLDQATTSALRIYEPGGPIHAPFLGTLITGKVRAYIHQWEHATQAFHTSTDGLLACGQFPDPIPAGPTSGLGAMVEEYRADFVVLLRNKTYVAYSWTETPKTTPSSIVDGLHVVKAAYHGLAGLRRDDLERMIWTGSREYDRLKFWSLKEEQIQGHPANSAQVIRMTTTIPSIDGLPAVTLRHNP